MLNAVVLSVAEVNLSVFIHPFIDLCRNRACKDHKQRKNND